VNIRPELLQFIGGFLHNALASGEDNEEAGFILGLPAYRSFATGGFSDEEFRKRQEDPISPA
jgi:hypothetical protein